MLIRQSKIIRNQILHKKKERSWGTKFGNLAIFLPINTSLYNTHKGGQCCTFREKHKKNLTLKTHLLQTSQQRPPLSQTKEQSYPTDFLFFFFPCRSLSQAAASFWDFLPLSPAPKNPWLLFVFPSADRNLQPSTRPPFPSPVSFTWLLHNWQTASLHTNSPSFFCKKTGD